MSQTSTVWNLQKNLKNQRFQHQIQCRYHVESCVIFLIIKNKKIHNVIGKTIYFDVIGKTIYFFGTLAFIIDFSNLKINLMQVKIQN
jgi:hypothetical protein